MGPRHRRQYFHYLWSYGTYQLNQGIGNFARCINGSFHVKKDAFLCTVCQQMAFSAVKYYVVHFTRPFSANAAEFSLLHYRQHTRNFSTCNFLCEIYRISFHPFPLVNYKQGCRREGTETLTSEGG